MIRVTKIHLIQLEISIAEMEKANSRYNIVVTLILTLILIFSTFTFAFKQYDIYSLRLVEESVSDKARIKW